MTSQSQSNSFESATDASTETDNPLRHRHIQSFVHRRSHFSKSQQSAYERLLPVFGLPFQANPLDFAAVFAKNQPVVLEIGCGMGETTAAIAQARADVNFLGLEVYNAGVAVLLQRIETMSLGNLRLIQHDAIDVLREMIPANSLSGLHIYCPDPWPKARHLKRRLIQAPFVASVIPHLKTGAYIHCATDVKDYAEQMLAVLSANPHLRNASTSVDGYHSPQNPFAHRPTTKFEARGQRLGHGMWDLVFIKK